MEVMATHVASAWLDGDMSEEAFWQFVRDALLPDIMALTGIIEPTFKSMPAEPVQDWSARDWEAFSEPGPLFYVAWVGAKRLIRRISLAELGANDSGNVVVSFLIAAMILRQLADDEIAGSKGNIEFHCNSTNVAPEFFNRCINVLGRRPFGAIEGLPLADLAKQLEDLARESVAGFENRFKELAQFNPLSMPSGGTR
jgi:hypothetical protein